MTTALGISEYIEMDTNPDNVNHQLQKTDGDMYNDSDGEGKSDYLFIIIYYQCKQF